MPDRTQGTLSSLLRERSRIDAELRRHQTEVTIVFTDIVGSTSYYDRFGNTAGIMQVQRHDDITAPERWDQALLNVGPEDQAIHRSIEQERSGDAIVAQRRDKGRSLPLTVWHLADKAFAARPSTVAAGHVRGCGSFIDEYELSWVELDLHLEPRLPRRGYVRPVLFGRVQAFF